MRLGLLLSVAVCGLLLGQALAETTSTGERDGKDIVTVRVTESTQSKQGLPIFPGISGKTAVPKASRC